MPWVRWVPLTVVPIAPYASVSVPTHNFSSYVIWNAAIVFRALPIGFQAVNPDSQIRSPRRFRCDRPPQLCPKLTYPPGPLRFVPCYISQLLICDAATYVSSEKCENLIERSAVSSAQSRWVNVQKLRSPSSFLIAMASASALRSMNAPYSLAKATMA